MWHLPGFLADLQVTGPDGEVLSENHYDLTAEEIRDFVTTVYPVPPVPPVDAILLKTADIAEASGAAHRAGASDTYSGQVLELGAGDEACAIRYDFAVPSSGEYLIRVACNSGEALAGFELSDRRTAG